MLASEVQSDADGATPLLTCIAGGDVASGDFYAPNGHEPALKYESQGKGNPEKVVLADWEKELMEQGPTVWADTYRGLGIEFDV